MHSLSLSPSHFLYFLLSVAQLFSSTLGPSVDLAPPCMSFTHSLSLAHLLLVPLMSSSYISPLLFCLSSAYFYVSFFVNEFASMDSLSLFSYYQIYGLLLSKDIGEHKLDRSLEPYAHCTGVEFNTNLI